MLKRTAAISAAEWPRFRATLMWSWSKIGSYSGRQEARTRGLRPKSFKWQGVLYLPRCTDFGERQVQCIS